MAYSSIVKPTDYFNTVTYTGNGGTQTISGVGFQPDFSWVKGRNYAYYHYLQDAVRGSQKILYTNNTDSEAIITAGISAWNADGYVTGSQGALNYSGRTFVAWNWLGANGTASNTDGSITSTVSANTTSGFSIVSYTGSATNPSTVGHGLGTAPAMIIVKNRSTSGRDWVIWHKALGGASSTDDLLLFTTGAKITSSGYWGSSAPSSTTFGVGNTNNNNANGDNFIAYCFAEKKGFSKFGSYVGNGSTDGSFIYTGFKPAFFMAKRSSAAGDPWVLIDNKRNPINALSNTLTPSDSNAENTGTDRANFLSNGIKIKTTSNAWNASGSTYIFMAFAENPLVANSGTDGVPATAR